MKVQLHIDGMACQHCSGRVKKFLESREGISDIDVSLEKKGAQFSCEDNVDVDGIVKGITELGYKALQQ